MSLKQMYFNITSLGLQTSLFGGQSITAGNSRFAKAGVWSFYENEMLNSSFVHLMKFSAKKNRLRKAAKRYVLYKSTQWQEN